jgi:hypothetical protein
MLTTIIVAIVVYIISGIAIYRRYLQLKSINRMMNAFKIDPDTQELLSRLGSDYDENGIPYWEKLKKEDDERA